MPNLALQRRLKRRLISGVDPLTPNKRPVRDDTDVLGVPYYGKSCTCRVCLQQYASTDAGTWWFERFVGTRPNTQGDGGKK